MDEAFELCGEDEIDKQYGEQEHQQDRAAGFLIRLAFTAIADGKHLRRGRCLFLQERKRLSLRVSGCKRSRQGDCAQFVEAAKVACACGFPILNKVGKRHQRAIARAELDRGQIFGRSAVLGIGLHDHSIFLAPVDIGRHPPRTEQRLQCLADIGDRYTKVARARGIDGNFHLRLRFLEIGIEIDDAGIFARRCQNPVACYCKRFIGGACDHEIERLTAPPPDR